MIGNAVTRMLISALLLLPCAAGADAGRLALVIGNGHYEALRPLQNPPRDAAAVAARLRALGFTLIGRDGKPTKDPVLDLDEDSFHLTVKRFAEASQRAGAEMALIYYAGHGMQVGDEALLLPIDVPVDDIELVQRNAIGLESILKRLDGRARLTVAVFDACREIPELEFAVTTATRSLGSGTSAFRGLARVRSEGRSRIVAYSAAAGQLAADGDGRHSPYTQMLLEELDQPGKEVGDLFRSLAYEFGQRHDGQQPELLIQGVPPDRFYFSSPREGNATTVGASPDPDRRSDDGRPPAPPISQGYLQIGVNVPKARVLVDGREVGEASAGRPLNLDSGFPVGPVEVEVSALGYRPQRHRVEIPLNDWAQLYVTLEAEAKAEPVPGEPEMVSVRGGCFEIGSPADEPERRGNERQKRVCLEDFSIGRYEVTQAQWKAVMGNNPSGYSGCDQCPVEQVSWNDVQTYITKLNDRTGKTYRLPTEAEWEYAARAGTRTPFPTGRCIDTDHANYDGRSDYDGCGARTGVYRLKTTPVGSFEANAWGLQDTAGNVWEWTCSTYDSGYGGAEQRCAGKRDSGARVMRGGSWLNEPNGLRTAYRLWVGPGERLDFVGFRLAGD